MSYDPLAAFYALAEAPRAPPLLAQIAEATGLSDYTLSDMLGIPRSTITSWRHRDRGGLTDAQRAIIVAHCENQMLALDTLLTRLTT
jgi:hypothetical protein